MHPPLVATALAVLTVLAGPVAAQTTYGAGVTVTDATPFARILERPNSLEGRTVRVDGVISSVCTSAGCGWIGLSGGGGSDYGNSVLVRVDPAKIVFPRNAVGKRVSVEGVVQSVVRDPDPAAKNAAAEYAQENTGGVSPAWELKATGAVVQ